MSAKCDVCGGKDFDEIYCCVKRDDHLRDKVLGVARKHVLQLKTHGVDLADGLSGRGIGIMLADVMEILDPGKEAGK